MELFRAFIALSVKIRILRYLGVLWGWFWGGFGTLLGGFWEAFGRLWEGLESFGRSGDFSVRFGCFLSFFVICNKTTNRDMSSYCVGKGLVV